MPYSSKSGKQYIKDVVRQLRPSSILDIGCGSGTYKEELKGLCAPKAFWHGVEIWRPYIEKFDLFSKYDLVTVGDARELKFDRQYDLCILGDVLEHMTEEQAKELLDKARKFCKCVIVSIPVGHYPQGEFEGNPHEAHITDNWTHESLIEVFGAPYDGIIDNEIGVLVYRKPKIAVYAISKNESKFVKRFCESAADADMVLIADTGSNDDTVELAQKHGATVHQISINPWRFDKARDAALALIPGDFDICVSLDLDEVLQPGWRAEIERVWKPNTTRLRYKFDWGAGIAFFYEKIHHRKGYHWHHPCHEYPVPDKRTVEVWAHTDMLLVVHQPDNTKSRGQYLDLLKVAVTEDPNCPRNGFYYPRELTFHRKWEEAIKELHRYLALPGATWPNERCYAMRLLGKSHEALGQHHEAMQWYRRATAEAPYTREPWCDLAMYCYRSSRWPECYAAATNALSIKNKEDVYTMDPDVWKSMPHDLAAISAFRMGMNNEAVTQGALAVSLAPGDKRLENNLLWYRGDIAKAA